MLRRRKTRTRANAKSFLHFINAAGNEFLRLAEVQFSERICILTLKVPEPSILGYIAYSCKVSGVLRVKRSDLLKCFVIR